MPRKPRSSTNRLPPLSGWKLDVQNALRPANPRSQYTATSLGLAIGRGKDFIGDIWRPHPKNPGSYRKNSFKAQEASAIETLLRLPLGTCARDDEYNIPPPPGPILRPEARPAVERRNPAPRALIEESLRLGVLLSQVQWTDDLYVWAAELIEVFLAEKPVSHEAPDIRRLKLELAIRRGFQK